MFILKLKTEKQFFHAEISDDKKVIKIPIAHGEGNYFADEELLKELEANKQILFRYSDEDGNVNDESNPNGSQLTLQEL